MEGHHLGLVQVPAPCTCIMWLTVHARCEAHQGFRKKGLPNAPTGSPPGVLLELRTNSDKDGDCSVTAYWVATAPWGELFGDRLGPRCSNAILSRHHQMARTVVAGA